MITSSFKELETKPNDKKISIEILRCLKTFIYKLKEIEGYIYNLKEANSGRLDRKNKLIDFELQIEFFESEYFPAFDPENSDGCEYEDYYGPLFYLTEKFGTAKV